MDSNAAITKLRIAVSQIGYLPRVFLLIWDASKGWTVARAIVLVLQGLMPAITMAVSRLIVDKFLPLLGGGFSWDTARPVVLLAIVMGAVLVFTEVLESLIAWIRTAQSDLVSDYVSGLVHKKSLEVDLFYYQSTEFHDQLERARNEANDRSVALLEGTGNLVQYGITLLAIAALLMAYGVWIPVALFVSALPVIYAVVRHNWLHYNWWIDATPRRRRAQYYDWVIMHSPFATEIRLFRLGSHFQQGYQIIRAKLRRESLRLVMDQEKSRVAAGLLGLAASSFASAWMVWRAFVGQVTLGDLVLFYQAFSRGQNVMRSLMSGVGQIYANSLFAKDLFDFLELKPYVIDPTRPIETPPSNSPLCVGIRFNNVTFTYPGRPTPALENFDLTVSAGQTVAIVGTNGAGKSTLVKLICRIYDPSNGSVEIEGCDIKEYSIDSLRRMITVQFQDFIPHYATAAENIAFGDLEANFGFEEIKAAAKQAGVHNIIAGLPLGYNTPLGYWFDDGTELSEGEWQRIAIARAFIKAAPIMLLDEPTSSMDSWAENEWLEGFEKATKDRTVLLITHRFTTAMIADVIHVMVNGHIVESGSHNELLTIDGHYAKSWKAQIQRSQARDPMAS